MCVYYFLLGLFREIVEVVFEIFFDYVYFLYVFIELEKGSMVFGRLDRFFGYYIGRVSLFVLIVFVVVFLLRR